MITNNRLPNMCCAFTGHRPQNLPWQFNEADTNCLKLKQILNQQISQLAKNGFTDFLSGMALGSDTWAAEAVLNLRKKNPALKLHCILPCKTQAEKWPVSEQERYQKILAQADSIFSPAATITQIVCWSATGLWWKKPACCWPCIMDSHTAAPPQPCGTRKG